ARAVRQGDADRVPQSARADAPRLGVDEARLDLTLLCGSAKKVGRALTGGLRGRQAAGSARLRQAPLPANVPRKTCDASSASRAAGVAELLRFVSPPLRPSRPRWRVEARGLF